MREILFRGKKISNGKWAYGYYTKGYFNPETPELLDMIYQFDKTPNGWESCYFIVAPETVGQFTGLTDKNGTRIFEGDIIKSDNGSRPPVISVVKFGENFPTMFYSMLDVYCPGRKHLPAICFYAETIDKHQHLILFQSPCVEVIGNIHDNPELIGERKGNGDK
jgi:uncharacterized phage protein (TIGR01671 family)